MKRILLLMIGLISLNTMAQQNVFSRDNSGTGDWGSANLPWFYGSNQGDPDNNNTVRNYVKIGHNNNTTMTTNGRYYIVNSLDFESAASAPRIINNSGGGLSVSGGIYNSSSATHTFNTPVGIDGLNVNIHNNASGGFVFNATIFINNNTVSFGNIGTGSISITGVMQGAGQVTKIGGNSLILSGQNTYTGNTTINAGTLQLNSVSGATLPASNDVVVNSGGTLRVSQNQTLNTITLNGGTIVVDAGIVLTVTNLISNGGTLSGTGSVRLTDVLTINAGTFSTNNMLTLVSTALNTARVAPVVGVINGEVTVERYISGRRAFRFLTPSVITATSIYANWQNGGVPSAGIGTQITGSTTGANGFDQTSSGNPSLYTYNAQATGTTTGFTAVTSTLATTLTAGVGYRILVRGDRNVDLNAPSSDMMNVPTTLAAKGALTTGTVTFDASSSTSPVLVNNNPTNTQTNGYTLIGNPYASPVDWNAVAKTGVTNDAYYSWDPTLGTAAQRGRYVVYTPTLGTSLYDNGMALSQTNRRYLQTGQAVFIKNADLAIPATLTFSEANKASTNSYVFKTNQQAATTIGNAALFLTLYDSNELAIGAAPIDGTAAVFGSGYNTDLDADDVEKLTAAGENVAFVRANKNLAIETLAPVVATDALFVKTIQFQANKNYTFKINTSNFDTALTAKMVDLYLNTETPIDLAQPSFVTFSTTSDASSFGSDRFKIVFGSTVLGNDSFNKAAISMYPNPITNNQFTIALPTTVTGNVTVRITTMLGQEVYRQEAAATPTLQIAPKQQLSEGIYIVTVTNNGQTLQGKVIVKK